MSIQPLLDTLERLVETHHTMLQLGKDKKNVVIKNDIDGLIKLLNQESRIMKQIEVLEKERQEACQLFLRERGIKSLLHLNLTEISRLVFDPEDKVELRKVQLKLSDVLSELKQINELNQQLIEQALAYIDYSLDLFRTPSEEFTYQHPSGNSGGSNRPGIFDARA
ncbi:flagellar protein FlgN [Paenibacillus sp. PSB04]|uniref:flagellar protein FlgN n=1 Tax=Paenibacillus sp. PSB04 TaxID=2866810 RepID=UPI0021F1528C|nr:flagellar protein FlgN [Paenibacillus sp. PSB04]UYO05204.1 flagellar protein FlgN [Paenibacillus sp. PSB04]